MKKIYLVPLLAAVTVAACSESKPIIPVQSLSGSVAASSVAERSLPQPTVIDPEPAVWAEFRATCALLEGGSPDCTCVLVGPQAVLTARHCIVGAEEEIPEDETRARQILLFGNSLREGACSVAPIGLDLAVCHLGEDPVTGIDFENLGRVPAASNTLLLTGFGCTSFVGSPGGSTLGKRSVPVRNLPGESSLIRLDNQLLCGGDSGGPGYVLLNNPVGGRLVVGINLDRTNLTRVSTSTALNFLDGWAQKNSTSICGVTPLAPGCRRL